MPKDFIFKMFAFVIILVNILFQLKIEKFYVPSS